MQWTDHGGTNQHFRVVDTDSGYVKLINRNSGKALDAWERSTADSARISQYTDTGEVVHAPTGRSNGGAELAGAERER